MQTLLRRSSMATAEDVQQIPGVTGPLRKRSRTDQPTISTPVWYQRHFGANGEGCASDRRMCKFCSFAAKAAPGSNPNHLGAHLLTAACSYLSSAEAMADSANVHVVRQHLEARQGLAGPSQEVGNNNVARLLLEWLLRDGLPLTIVESDAFLEFVQALKPDWTPPSRYLTVAQRVLCIPATAAANERVFSAFSHVWSDKRASLILGRMWVMAYIYFNKLGGVRDVDAQDPAGPELGPRDVGVPPSAANSLTTQPRPPWAPRASNSVALLPLGACRRGPPPALCWAAAYEMVDLVTEVVVPGGAAAVRVGGCPPQLARLVMLCMDHDPIRRPSALEAVRELALLQQRLFPVLPPPALTATSGSQGSGSEPNNNNSNNGTFA
ncbi:hypothetical protein QJQ45_024338 [Haematococcus lacustris]|nr:hypothetical protein QJQ45_024338 [Haematococcus lacustris]